LSACTDESQAARSAALVLHIEHYSRRQSRHASYPSV
jgi:hypothetical protein